MNVIASNRARNLWLASTMALCFACGGEQSDPNVIGRDDLKSPGGLSLIDNGDGTVQLRWFTSNYEDDFEGYNIYGAAGTATELGVTEGEPIQLLDNSGNAIEGAKTILAKFSYSAENSQALPGTTDLAEADTSEEGELKFSAYPYHKLRTANKQPNLPTCKPNLNNDTGSCVFLGASKDETDAEDINSVGELSFTFPPSSSSSDTLTAGQSYCFFVFAVQDQGKEISQSSTNVACIVPKFKVNASTVSLAAASDAAKITATGSDNGYTEFRSNCITSGVCTTISMTPGQSQLNASSLVTWQIESYGESIAYLVTGKSAAIRPLGFFADGFADSRFSQQIAAAPALSLSASDTAKNPNGYSIEGQSVPIYANHIYVLASGDQSSDEVSSFYYDWIYIDSVDCSSNCSVSFEMLLSRNLDERSR